MSAAPYKMTEMIPSTSAHLIDRSEDVIFELVWVIKRSILSFPVYITKKNVACMTGALWAKRGERNISPRLAHKAPVMQAEKNVKSVIDSAVLHWTTRLMVFPRNAGLGRCYLVSTRHEILSNIDRNLTGTQQLICIFHTRLQYKNHVCRPSIFFKFTATNRF